MFGINFIFDILIDRFDQLGGFRRRWKCISCQKNSKMHLVLTTRGWPRLREFSTSYVEMPSSLHSGVSEIAGLEYYVQELLLLLIIIVINYYYYF